MQTKRACAKAGPKVRKNQKFENRKEFLLSFFSCMDPWSRRFIVFTILHVMLPKGRGIASLRDIQIRYFRLKIKTEFEIIVNKN